MTNKYKRLKKTAGAVDSAARAYRLRMDIAKKTGRALAKFRPSGSAADTGAAMQMMERGRAAKASAAATLREASTPTRTVPNRPVVHGEPRWPGDPRHKAKLNRAAAQTKKNPTREVPIPKKVSGRQGKIDFLRAKLKNKTAGFRRVTRIADAIAKRKALGKTPSIGQLKAYGRAGKKFDRAHMNVGGAMPPPKKWLQQAKRRVKEDRAIGVVKKLKNKPAKKNTILADRIKNRPPTTILADRLKRRG